MAGESNRTVWQPRGHPQVQGASRAALSLRKDLRGILRHMLSNPVHSTSMGRFLPEGLLGRTTRWSVLAHRAPQGCQPSGCANIQAVDTHHHYPYPSSALVGTRLRSNNLLLPRA